jgi:hypothetical protein
VILSPLATLPITGAIIWFLPDCGVDEPWWQLGHIRLALLPGLLDLVPLVWLVSARAKVRRAAAVAGVIGVARVALPQLVVGLYAAGYGGEGAGPSCSVSVFLLTPLVLLMLGVWAASALFCGVALRRATRPLAA